MMKSKHGLVKRKNDIKFFDLNTMEVVCTFNQCIDKFTISGQEEIVKNPKWNQGNPVHSISHFHQCNECGKKVSSKEDKKTSKNDFEKSILQGPERTKKRLSKRMGKCAGEATAGSAKP